LPALTSALTLDLNASLLGDFFNGITVLMLAKHAKQQS